MGCQPSMPGGSVKPVEIFLLLYRGVFIYLLVVVAEDNNNNKNVW